MTNRWKNLGYIVGKYVTVPKSNVNMSLTTAYYWQTICAQYIVGLQYKEAALFSVGKKPHNCNVCLSNTDHMSPLICKHLCFTVRHYQRDSLL